MRALAIISGIGLVILFLVGLGTPGAASWLTWLDGVGGVLCFIGAGAARDRSSAVSSSTVLALGLFALWIIGMLTNGAPFQNWWTFAFACVMVVAAILGSRITPATRTGTIEEERFRRAG